MQKLKKNDLIERHNGRFAMTFLMKQTRRHIFISFCYVVLCMEVFVLDLSCLLVVEGSNLHGPSGGPEQSYRFC